MKSLKMFLFLSFVASLSVLSCNDTYPAGEATEKYLFYCQSEQLDKVDFGLEANQENNINLQFRYSRRAYSSSHLYDDSSLSLSFNKYFSITPEIISQINQPIYLGRPYSFSFNSKGKLVEINSLNDNYVYVANVLAKSQEDIAPWSGDVPTGPSDDNWISYLKHECYSKYPFKIEFISCYQHEEIFSNDIATILTLNFYNQLYDVHYCINNNKGSITPINDLQIGQSLYFVLPKIDQYVYYPISMRYIYTYNPFETEFDKDILSVKNYDFYSELKEESKLDRKVWDFYE